MNGSEPPATPVKVKAVLVDPATMTVAWLDESAAQSLVGVVADEPIDIPLEAVVPAAVDATPREIFASVARTGEPRHLRSDVVSMTQGSVSMLTSVYRLPDGMLLVLTENAWLPSHGERDRGAGRRPPRRGR